VRNDPQSGGKRQFMTRCSGAACGRSPSRSADPAADRPGAVLVRTRIDTNRTPGAIPGASVLAGRADDAGDMGSVANGSRGAGQTRCPRDRPQRGSERRGSRGWHDSESRPRRSRRVRHAGPGECLRGAARGRRDVHGGADLAVGRDRDDARSVARRSMPRRLRRAATPLTAWRGRSRNRCAESGECPPGGRRGVGDDHGLRRCRGSLSSLSGGRARSCPAAWIDGPDSVDRLRQPPTPERAPGRPASGCDCDDPSVLMWVPPSCCLDCSVAIVQQESNGSARIRTNDSVVSLFLAGACCVEVRGECEARVSW